VANIIGYLNRIVVSPSYLIFFPSFSGSFITGELERYSFYTSKARMFIWHDIHPALPKKAAISDFDSMIIKL
jgi:hypothetical protein